MENEKLSGEAVENTRQQHGKLASLEMSTAVKRACRQLRANQCVALDIARMRPFPEEMLSIGKAVLENTTTPTTSSNASRLRSIVLPTSCTGGYPPLHRFPDVMKQFQKILQESKYLQKVEFHATSEYTDFLALSDLLISLSANNHKTQPKQIIFSDIRGLVQDLIVKDNSNTSEKIIQALRNGAFASVSCICCSQYVTALVLEGLTGNQTCEKLAISPVRGLFQNSVSLVRVSNSSCSPTSSIFNKNRRQHCRQHVEANRSAYETMNFPRPIHLGPFIARLFQSTTPLKSFHFYQVWQDDLDPPAHAMAHHPTLQDLVLYGQHDADPWLIAANLCTIIRRTRTLERLSLSNLKFDSDSLFELSRAMQQNASVKYLSVYRCGQKFKVLADSAPLCRLDTKSFALDMATLHPSHIHNVCRAIRHSKSLEHLTLSNLPEISFKPFFTALAKSTSLASLDLSANVFTTALNMLACIVGKSQESCNLRQLTLRIRETSTLEVAQVLCASEVCCLESLRLFQFPIGPIPMLHLLKLVENNTTLTRLHLRGGPLTEGAFCHLCDCLPELNHLKDLRFDWPAQTKNTEKFLSALDKNRSLLDIGGSLAPVEAREAGARIIARNRIRTLAGGDGVPGGLWPHVFSCRGFARQPSLLCVVVKEVVGRGAWPTAASRKRASSHLPTPLKY